MKKTFFIFLFFLIFLLYEFISFVKLIPSENQINQSLENLDAVIVLTGGQNRIKDGINLQKKYKIKKLFISGVNNKTSLEEIFEAQDLDKNDLKENIEIGKMAKSTIGNRKEVEKWAKINSIKKVALVTSDYHVPRSYLLFKSSKIIESVEVYPSFGSKFTAENIFKDRSSTKIVFVEFFKYLVCKWSIFISDL